MIFRKTFFTGDWMVVFIGLCLSISDIAQVQCNNCFTLTRVAEGSILTQSNEGHSVSKLTDCAEICRSRPLCKALHFRDTPGRKECHISYMSVNNVGVTEESFGASVYTVERMCHGGVGCPAVGVSDEEDTHGNHLTTTDDQYTTPYPDNTAPCVSPEPDISIAQLCIQHYERVYVESALRAQDGKLVMFTDKNLMITCVNFGVVYNREDMSDPNKCTQTPIQPNTAPINPHGGFNDGPPTMATGWVESNSEFTLYYLFRGSKVYMYKHSDADIMSYIGMSTQESDLPLAGAVLSTWPMQNKGNPILYMIHDDWVTSVYLTHSSTYDVVLTSEPEPMNNYIDVFEPSWFGTNLTRVMCGIQAITEDTNQRNYLFFKGYEVYYLGHKQMNPTEGPLTYLGNICLL